MLCIEKARSKTVKIRAAGFLCIICKTAKKRSHFFDIKSGVWYTEIVYIVQFDDRISEVKMDRYEYKTKIDEIRMLMKEGRQDEALDLCDAVNWQKIHNVNALLGASEIYEAAGRLEDSRQLLEIAHDRSPVGRMILYHLVLVCIKMGDLESARGYYQEFVQIAPHDSLKYSMKYYLGKASGADDSTLIGILEELKSHDFLEDWAYELAYLYHKTGQIDKCIELCDEIVLWFGDGPYVEHALELKMLYQPLDKLQEDKYRHFQQKRDGITEVEANEALASGEIVPHTVAIPEVALPPERFNTVNLQAEIKKNIDEIMLATEAGEISENMENIKSLVEEIPYLQMGDGSEERLQEKQKAEEEINSSLKDVFQGYLEEEYDGQISFCVPEENHAEAQVRGQMTIEDVMNEWEKTKRAAEMTLQEAEQQKLQSARELALKEANSIMDRLEDVIPRLDAGVTPSELLKEEYLSQPLPKTDAPEAESDLEGDADMDYKEASKLVEDVNQILQEEIDKLQKEEGTQGEEPEGEESEESVETDIAEEAEATDVTEESVGTEQSETETVETTATEAEDDIRSVEEKLLADLEKVDPLPENDILPEVETVMLEDDEVAAFVDEKVLEKAIADEMPIKELNRDEKAIFSYFMPVSGMESSICQALTGAKYRLERTGNSSTGNIIIQGEKGCGKTMMAGNLVKALQMEIHKPKGNVGKIDGKKLNHKDLQALFGKIRGGCLIIEKAGGISRETAVTLSLLMENDTSGILVIMEDTKAGIESVLSKDASFAKKFTEKITIPVFTIDELVNFGKTYAEEMDCVVDEMAVLAMYNRINLIQRVDHGTSLTEVKEIMDDAIDHAQRGGLRAVIGRLGTKKYDDDGNLILREKDFEL